MSSLSRVCAMLIMGLAVAAVSTASFADDVLFGFPPESEGESNCFPFNCVTTGRYQQVYSSTIFTAHGAGPILITDVKFFDTLSATFDPPEGAVISTGTYTFKLSTTTVAVGALAGPDAAGMDSNIGGDETVVFSGVLGGPVGVTDVLTILFTTPFLYDPSAGNLLLEIVNESIDSVGAGFMDAHIGPPAGVDFSRMHTYGSGFSDFGLVTAFSHQEVVVPEPASLALFALGGLGLGLGWLRRKQSA